MYLLFICDDDPVFAAFLAEQVQALFSFSCQIETFYSAQDFSAAVSAKRPDIALLDIELGPDNGISLVKELFPDGSNTQVIYITGYAEYCTDVYETEHIYFLLKPLKLPELQRSLSKAVEHLDLASVSLVIQNSDTICNLPLSQIHYIESHLRKLYIYTAEKRYEMNSKLSSLPGAVQRRMVHCHKSFLVNPQYIHAIVTPDGSFNKHFQLLSGQTIPISQSKWRTCRQEFLSLLTQTSPGGSSHG